MIIGITDLQTSLSTHSIQYIRHMWLDELKIQYFNYSTSKQRQTNVIFSLFINKQIEILFFY